MRSRTKRPYARIALLWIALGALGCGGGGSTSLRSFSMHSASVGDDYQVYVSLPHGYDEVDTTRYDTIYLLDGQWTVSWAPGMVEQLVEQGQMEPVILVEVCPVEALRASDPDLYRERDFTPTIDPATPGTGYAENFASFLRNELIPYVDTNFRTHPTREGRGLSGQSLGGLFTWYAVFTMSDVFSKFVPASASIWYEDHVLYRFEAEYAEGHSDLAAAIYSTVSTGEWSQMASDRDELVSRLIARGYPSLSLQTKTYSGLAHTETSGPSFHDGWAALY